MENGQSELMAFSGSAGVAPIAVSVGDVFDLKIPLVNWRELAQLAATPGTHLTLKVEGPDGSRCYSEIIQLFGDRMLKLKVKAVLDPGVEDCHFWDEDDRRKRAARVFVDGQEIKGVWYTDTRRGLVKTYDIRGMGFGIASPLQAAPADFPGREIEQVGGVLSETLHGKVEFMPLDETE